MKKDDNLYQGRTEEHQRKNESVIDWLVALTLIAWAGYMGYILIKLIFNY